MTQVARYSVGVGLQIDKRTFIAFEKQMKQMEKSLTQQAARMNKILTTSLKGFKVPELKLNVSLDSLKAQKSVQVELNKVSKLLSLPISNFNIDQIKLNRQVSVAFARAANVGKLNIKTIGGAAGGGGLYDLTHKQQSSMQRSAASYQSLQNKLPTGFNAGVPAGVGAGIGMAAGIGAGVAGGIGYGAFAGTQALYRANKTAVSDRNFISNVSGNPGATDEENKRIGKQSYKFLYDTSNELGQDAKGNVEGYGQIIAGIRASGKSLDAAQNIYKNLQEHATVMHLSNEKQKRLSYAVTQMYSKGKLSSEEVFQQSAEADPTFPAYLAKAWAQQTKSGLEGTAAMVALRKSMEDGKVKSDTLTRALELASKDAQRSLVTSTRTSLAEENRIKNTVSFQLNESSIAGVEDSFYRINKVVGNFASDMAPIAGKMAVSATEYLAYLAEVADGTSNLAKGKAGAREKLNKVIDSPYKWAVPLSPLTAFAGLTYTGYNLTSRWMNPEQSERLKTAPSFGLPNDLTQGSYHNYREEAMNKAFGGSTPATTVNSPVTFSAGAITIQTMATDADGIAADLEPRMIDLFKRQQATSLMEASQSFSYKE